MRAKTNSISNITPLFALLWELNCMRRHGILSTILCCRIQFFCVHLDVNNVVMSSHHFFLLFLSAFLFFVYIVLNIDFCGIHYTGWSGLILQLLSVYSDRSIASI